MKKSVDIRNYQETNKITKVTGGEGDDDYYTINQGSMCCGLKTKYGVKPKVGDMLTVHTKGGSFGTIRGMDLNGVRIFWKSDVELDKDREDWLRKNEERKQKAFEENVTKMDAQYDALPKVFRDRIDRFRKNNETFRQDFESYELFCCEQAVIIAKACGTKEKIQEFKDMSWDDQVKIVEDLDDGHSGNTFGCACSLAYVYLDNEDNIAKVHGSLSPLVGSRDFGDLEKETVKLVDLYDDMKELGLTSD